MRFVAFSILICAALSAKATPAEDDVIAVASSLYADQIAVGDTAVVGVFVEFSGNPLYWLFDSLMPPTTMGLKFINSRTTSHTQRSGDDVLTRTKIELRFSATRTGQLTISPWQWNILHIVGGDTTQIDTIPLSFGGFALTGLPPPKRHLSAKTVTLIIVGAFLSIAVIVLVVVWISRSRKRKSPIQPQRTLSNEEIAIQKLSKISLQLMSTEEIVGRITDAIKKYISDEFGISAGRMATEEILSSLSSRGLAGQRFVLLRSLLNACDDIRFAQKYPDAQEMKELLSMATEFVRGGIKSNERN